MSVSFGSKYAKYYDTIYADKDYPSECDYVEKVFKMFRRGRVKKILDISCGTGGHSLVLARRGYSVDALDASEAMLSIAKLKAKGETRIRFHRSDMRDFHVEKKYDACLSIFGSLNYIVEDRELELVFQRVADHLEDGGLFLFDVWYGPAVITQKPEVRVKDISLGTRRIIRIATPRVDYSASTNRTTYKILVFDKDTKVDEFEENHLVRYFFIPEVATLLKRTGFHVASVHPFMSLRRKVTVGDWNVSFVGSRVRRC